MTPKNIEELRKLLRALRKYGVSHYEYGNLKISMSMHYQLDGYRAQSTNHEAALKQVEMFGTITDPPVDESKFPDGDE